MEKTSWGTLHHLLFIGGGPILVQSASQALSLGFEVTVFAAPRHYEEVVDEENRTLSEALSAAGIRCVCSDEINDDERLLGEIRPSTLGVAIGPAWIFKRKMLDALGGRFVNFHGIPLPRYRGGAHSTWRIMKKDRRWGCHIQLIDERLDAGDVIKTKEFMLPDTARIPADDFAFCLKASLEFLEEFFQEVRAGKAHTRRKLDESESTFFPRLSTQHQGYIDWSWDTSDLEAFICAFDNPYAGAATFVNGQRVRLKGCTSHAQEGPFHPFQSGLIYRKGPAGLSIATRSGTLVIQKVLDDSGKELGPKLREGSRFHTPHSFLDQARMVQAAYDARGLKSAPQKTQETLSR